MKNTENNFQVAIIGLGYVGLPTAISFHEAGFNTVGIDISESIIQNLKNGESHLIEENNILEIPVNSSRWEVSTDFTIIENSDIILITVPTPVTKENRPNLEFVKSACDSVLNYIKKGALIVLESTVYPGVTREILTEIGAKKGLVIGTDFSFAYSPERVSPGDIGKSSSEVAKIVGMDNKEKGIWLAEIYSKITTGGSTYVGSPEVAEAAKLIENTQRDIDIAFVNELAIILPMMGLDVGDVLSAADTKWNFHKHTPGIGIGGHCIPVDPYFYIEISEKLGFKSKISTAAREINVHIEEIASNQIINLIKKYDFKSVIFLGYSYKPNVGDVRETPVRNITNTIFQATKIKPLVWDPLVDKKNYPNWIINCEDPYEITNDSLIVISTAHNAVLNLSYQSLGSRFSNRVIYDGRRVLEDLKDFQKNDWDIYAIGKPGIN